MKKTLTILVLIASIKGYTQDSIVKKEVIEEPKKKFENSLGELKFNIDQKGEKFVKFGLSSHFWARVIENNPGTMVNNTPQNTTYDIGLRRMRISMNAKLSNYYSLVLQFGINNQSFISGGGSGTGANGYGKKPQIFFIDAYADIPIIPTNDFNTKKPNKNNLYVGAGLHAWSGVSRMTNASTTKMLAADLPVFNFPNIEVSDQFSRQFGFFAHGEFDRLNYRFAVGKPFATNQTPKVGGGAVDNNQSGKLSFAGYGMYQFLEKESTPTAVFAGTYLGTKKVFNIGMGFYSTSDATLSQPKEGEFQSHNEFLLGLDSFLDIPIGTPNKEMALTLYNVFYKSQYGHNYIRTTALMNPGTEDPNYEGTKAMEGFGNARFLMGTGNIFYSQAGFVLPKFSNFLKLQPFVAFARKDLDALNQVGHYYDLGANLYLYSQNAKIAYQYSSRPLYDPSNKTIFDRKREHLLTLQIAF